MIQDVLARLERSLLRGTSLAPGTGPASAGGATARRGARHEIEDSDSIDGVQGGTRGHFRQRALWHRHS